MSAKKKNLDAHLAEIFNQFIAINDRDFKKSQEVFKIVFGNVKSKMEQQCNFFKKYSKQTMYAGSVYDGIKISKLDEFDMDIVIRLPIDQKDKSEKGLIIERDQPGFVKMKIIDAFDNIDKQPEWEKCHVVTKDWRDTDKYFLQNKFRSWLHGIVQKALNDMNREIEVLGVRYFLTYKESGPAFTLNVKNCKGQEKFNLDVDLVPVIKLQLPRWPEGYRTIENTQSTDWFVVPKPNKALKDDVLRNRCWRLSFQEFERDMMKDRQLLKTTIRLVKKLRDTLDMRTIASYYIKTIFLWKINATDKKYWQTRLSSLFLTMVKELYVAIERKNIPYYWHSGKNLIDDMKPSLQKVYLERLDSVVKSIEANDVDAVVAALLTKTELQEFQKLEFHQKFAVKETNDDVPDSPSPATITKQVSTVKNTKPKQDNDKFDDLITRISLLEERVKCLELANKCQSCLHKNITLSKNEPDSQDSGISSLIDFD